MITGIKDTKGNLVGFASFGGLSDLELIERGYLITDIPSLEEALPVDCYQVDTADSDSVVLKPDWEAILATFPEPEPVPEPAVIGATAYRVQEIEARLLVIDQLTIRPLRAELAGTGTEADRERLGELEAEATELRGELQSLRV